jgi:hypothetical protein
MTDPRLADKILVHLLSDYQPFERRFSVQLAQEIKEDLKQVELTVLEINKRHNWLVLRDGVGEGSIIIEKFNCDLKEIKNWIKSGGYLKELNTVILGNIVIRGMAEKACTQIPETLDMENEIAPLRKKMTGTLYVIYFIVGVLILFGLMVIYAKKC